MFLFCLVFALFCARLFICALWSPAGKGLTLWLSFVVSSVSLSLSHWGAQWLSGRVLDSRPKGRGFEPHRRHCVVSLSKNINPSLVLVQPRKTRPFITERLLMGRKESNQTKTKLSHWYPGSGVVLDCIDS